MTTEDEQYFKDLESRGINLTQAQKNRYVLKKEELKEKMKREYPSYFEEAFQVSGEGAYYTKELNRAYTQKRVHHVPYDPKLEVYTAWDIG